MWLSSTNATRGPGATRYSDTQTRETLALHQGYHLQPPKCKDIWFTLASRSTAGVQRSVPTGKHRIESVLMRTGPARPDVSKGVVVMQCPQKCSNLKCRLLASSSVNAVEKNASKKGGQALAWHLIQQMTVAAFCQVLHTQCNQSLPLRKGRRGSSSSCCHYGRQAQGGHPRF
jgi:hypothetical protein